MRLLINAVVSIFVVGTCLAHDPPLRASGPFRYDPADEELAATVLAGPSRYDGDLLVEGETTWLTWLDHTPGGGDALRLGRRRGERAHDVEGLDLPDGAYASPTLTRDARGRRWLSYERRDGPADWNVHLHAVADDGTLGPGMRVSPSGANDIRHRVAAAPDGDLVFVWQGDSDGQFDVLLRRLGPEGVGPVARVSESRRGDWHPAVAVGQDGAVQVVWDSFDGRSFDVLGRRWHRGRWDEVLAIAAGPAFEGRADVAVDAGGRTWVSWEEGATCWGDDYRSVATLWNNVSDTYGPLHSLRKLRIARLESGGVVSTLANPLPMPALSAPRPGRRDDVREVGVFYERARLVVDDLGRVWVAWRHFYQPQLGATEPVEHHVEEGWRLYARCLEGDSWSKLYRFDVLQRDGMQRMELAPTPEGIALVWTTGRTDRRPNDAWARGLVLGRIAHPAGPDASTPLLAPRMASRPRPARVPPARAPVVVGDRTFRSFFGDLHRHTDLSLCFPFFDGSLDDAYRYAIDVARLDYLGITDHTRDIHHGDVLSQLWWRCTKEVTRHRLQGSFFPFFAYERSHRDTDHNVISLDDDRLRDFPPPLPEFWREIDGNTFTIPHNPFIGKVWEHHDDVKRPLLEMYQGFRNEASEAAASDGLGRGFHFGFIASSDHLSTSGSYAGVWAPSADREAIFRALQARRTFAATAPIRILVRADADVMGERIRRDESFTITVAVDSTAAIDTIEVIRNGDTVARWTGFGGERRVERSLALEPPASGESWVWVRVRQHDLEQAWSSPLWISRQRPESGSR